MIALTRLNSSMFYVNPDMIVSVEATPDTVITLTNNEKLVVRESPEEICDRYVQLKRRIHVQGMTASNADYPI